MQPRSRSLLFGLQGALSRHNGFFCELGPFDPVAQTVAVRLADGGDVRVPRANVLMQQDIPRVFAAPVGQLTDLDAVTAVAPSAHGRCVVATAPLASGSVLRTSIVQVEMTADDIEIVQARFKRFARNNMAKLLRMPEQRVDIAFGTGYGDYMLFMRAFLAVRGHPTIASLMAIDFFDPDFLTLHWRRTAAEDLVWLQFWIDELSDEVSPEDVFRNMAFMSAYAYPNPCATHTHGKLIFGRISFAQCHDKRWKDLLMIMDGELSNKEPRHTGQHLGTTLIHDVQDTCMQMLVVVDVNKGDEVTLDYGATYACDSKDTVLNIQDMPFPASVQWMQLYVNVAGNVNQALQLSLAAYLIKRVPNIQSDLDLLKLNRLEAKAGAGPGLPRCANAACARPMQDPKRCSKCKAAMYCNKDCQTAAWPTHKRECVPAGAK